MRYHFKGRRLHLARRMRRILLVMPGHSLLDQRGIQALHSNEHPSQRALIVICSRRTDRDSLVERLVLFGTIDSVKPDALRPAIVHHLNRVPPLTPSNRCTLRFAAISAHRRRATANESPTCGASPDCVRRGFLEVFLRT